jgi:hypothetical protein
MLNLRNPVVWLIGIVVIAAISLLLRGHFSAEVRERLSAQAQLSPIGSPPARVCYHYSAQPSLAEAGLSPASMSKFEGCT